MRTKRISRCLVLVALALALIAAMLLPSVAGAYPLVDLDEVRVDNSAVANISGSLSGSFYAGNYILSISSPSGSGNPSIQYTGYCVEPSLAPTSSQVYELLPITQGSAFAAAAWILSQNYTTLAPAAQAAVWELTWDTTLGNPYSLGAGNFQLVGGIAAGDVGTIYDNAVAAMNAGFNPSGYFIANSPVGSTGWEYPQGYIIHNPVPIPPTALLLGTGLLGLVGLRKWRRQPGA